MPCPSPRRSCLGVLKNRLSENLWRSFQEKFQVKRNFLEWLFCKTPVRDIRQISLLILGEFKKNINFYSSYSFRRIELIWSVSRNLSSKSWRRSLNICFSIQRIRSLVSGFPDGIYLLKVSNRSIRIWCEICSKLSIKTPERHLAFVNFEHISHLVLVFLLLTLNM